MIKHIYDEIFFRTKSSKLRQTQPTENFVFKFVIENYLKSITWSIKIKYYKDWGF